MDELRIGSVVKSNINKRVKENEIIYLLQKLKEHNVIKIWNDHEDKNKLKWKFRDKHMETEEIIIIQGSMRKRKVRKKDITINQ